jgi:hypothetical protein
MTSSVYTIHQAKFKDGRLSELQILCRDEPEPPVFFYEETVVPVEQVIKYMLMGDIFYAQWGNDCYGVELLKLETGDEVLEVAPRGQDAFYCTLANLPCEKRIFG